MMMISVKFEKVLFESPDHIKDIVSDSPFLCVSGTGTGTGSG